MVLLMSLEKELHASAWYMFIDFSCPSQIVVHWYVGYIIDLIVNYQNALGPA
jgi:hypothetical protein